MKICPNCAAENVDTAKFCNECGVALQIRETKPTENASVAESVLDTVKEDTDSEKSVKPFPTVETVLDTHESLAEKTEKKEESSSKKKSRIIIGIVAIALICIITYIATRPKVESLNVIYRGDQQEGIVLDDDNTGISVVANYSNGKTKEIPLGEWHIQSPKTLKADSDETVVVTYKNVSYDLTVSCTTTKLVSADASYKGSQYEGTVINHDSDIVVTATYGDGHTETFDNSHWRLEPSEVTLQAGVESQIKLIVTFDDGTEGSAVFSITGKEKPLDEMKIEGDHYNFSAEQLVAYLEQNFGYSFSTERQTKIGDSYFYQVSSSNDSDTQSFSMEIRENASGKVNYVAFTSDDIMEGLDTSILLARAFGGTMTSVEKNDMTFQMFMISKMHVSDDTLIECVEHSDTSGYSFYIMPNDYSEKFWKEQYSS